jgi:hypothetical protein
MRPARVVPVVRGVDPHIRLHAGGARAARPYDSPSSFEDELLDHAHPAMPMAARPSRLRVTIFLPRPERSGLPSAISRQAARCSDVCADRAWSH